VKRQRVLNVGVLNTYLKITSVTAIGGVKVVAKSGGQMLIMRWHYDLTPSHTHGRTDNLAARSCRETDQE